MKLVKTVYEPNAENKGSVVSGHNAAHFLSCSFDGRGYPHDSRAHKDSYPHDCHADNAPYRHDRHADENPFLHNRNIRFSYKLNYALFSILMVSFL